MVEEFKSEESELRSDSEDEQRLQKSDHVTGGK
jgi:hypothetical protein